MFFDFNVVVAFPSALKTMLNWVFGINGLFLVINIPAFVNPPQITLPLTSETSIT